MFKSISIVNNLLRTRNYIIPSIESSKRKFFLAVGNYGKFGENSLILNIIILMFNGLIIVFIRVRFVYQYY